MYCCLPGGEGIHKFAGFIDNQSGHHRFQGIEITPHMTHTQQVKEFVFYGKMCRFVTTA